MKSSPSGTPIIDRLVRLYEIRADGCWQWIGSIDYQGYGRIVLRVDGRPSPRTAHREVYRQVVGDIEPDLVLDHLCRNRSCVNPDHLEQVTDLENRARGLKSPTKAHCKKGHLFDEANTYWHGPSRHCRTCNRANVAAYKLRRAAA